MKNLIFFIVLVWMLANLLPHCFDNGGTKRSSPLSHQEKLVDSILFKSNLDFEMKIEDDIHFYYEKNRFFARNINSLMKDALLSKQTCIKLLGYQKPAFPIKIIYFSDRERLQPFLNMTPKAIALSEANSLLIATNDTIRAYHTHEMMHIFAIHHFDGYAKVPGDWIQEGISAYADKPCLGYSLHSIAAYLLYSNKLPAIDSLFYQFRALPDMIAYMYAGSLAGYLIENYGVEKFKQIWQWGLENLPIAIGKTTEELQLDYLGFLCNAFPDLPAIDWNQLDKKGCG